MMGQARGNLADRITMLLSREKAVLVHDTAMRRAEDKEGTKAQIIIGGRSLERFADVLLWEAGITVARMGRKHRVLAGRHNRLVVMA